MALTEQKILKQVTLLPQQGAINVQWSNQILRGEEVISEQYERKAYTAEQVEDFLAEVEGGEVYVQAIGWA